AQSRSVGHRYEPGVTGDPESPSEIGRVTASLVVRQPKSDYSQAGVFGRQPGEGARVQGMTCAVRRNDHAHREPGSPAGLAYRIQYQIGEGGNPLETSPVPGRVHLNFGPHRTVGGIIGGRFGDETTDVIGCSQDGPGDVVKPLKPEPAFLIGR